jgi:hypothetical protein
VQDTTNVDDIFLNENKNSIEVYPNPVTDQLHISYNVEDTYSFEIFNSTMQKTLTGICHSQHIIDFSKIPKGIYLLVVFDKKNKMIERMKIVK